MRRGLLRRAVAVAAALATVGGALVAAPADASTPAVTIRAMGGDRQVTAAWSRVPSATGYTVHWGAGTSTAHALRTTGSTIRISGVSNFTSYSVRVTADGTTAASNRVTATPSPYAPTPITSVRAVPAGPNQITVSWTGGGRARSIAVYVGSDSQTMSHHYATAWHPAALSSWTVTLPPSIRGVLGAGTGNPVFVRVVQTNSTASSPRMGWSFDSATRFRLSTVGPWTIAGAARSTAPTSPVTVASWNAQTISVTASLPQHTWAKRLPKVVRNIEDLHPDVIGFQELGTSRVVAGCLNKRLGQGIYDCQEQYQSLESALQSTAIPYRNVRADENAYVYQQIDAHNPDNFVDSSLFYNPARVDLVSSGFLSPRSFMGSDLPSSYTDEAGVWAVFRTKDAAAREFLTASIHMPAFGENLETVQRAEGMDLATWLDAKAGSLGGLPIVLTGDFNGDGVLSPDAPNLRLIADGYTDAAATTDRNSIQWCTANVTNGPDGVDSGYPVHAVPHLHWGSRIDYIMLKGGVTTSRYRNEIRYTTQADGRRLFDPQYQGSDHNMQLAWLGIPDPKQS